jgi:hypothetical protein
MKKAIKRFWGIGLIVIILSSFFLVTPVAPASGNIYSWALDSTQPTANNRLFAAATGYGINDIAATSDGATIYIVAGNTSGATPTGTNYLYKSTNGGVTWSQLAASGITSANMSLVACAPDDPNIIVVVDAVTNLAGSVAYLSTNGGSSFSTLGTINGGVFTAKDVAVSATLGTTKWIAVAGNTTNPVASSTGGKVYAWPYGSSSPTWYDTFANNASPYLFATGTVAPSVSDVTSVAFSPSFPSDAVMLCTTTSLSATAGSVVLHAASFNIYKWDASIDTSWPRSLATTSSSALTSSNTTSIALDPTFYFGDPASQIGFVGAEITTAAGEIGGVYRISTYSGGKLTQVYGSAITGGYAVGYVAWDGTNLAAAPDVESQTSAGTAITIQRSADALTSSTPTFTPSSGLKTPGTGYVPKLLWNGGNLLCVSRGTNAGVAKSTDLGKSFNGIALINSSWATIDDYQVCAACSSVIYVLAADGTPDTNVWRYMNSVWQRVMIIPNSSGTWEMRVGVADPTVVLIGLRNGASMYISTDSGEFKWTARSCSSYIQDFAVESASVVYVATTTSTAPLTGVNVVKSTNGAFTWAAGVNTQIGLYGTNYLYSISLVAAGKVLVTGTNGAVAYSTDSAATWTAVPALTTSSTNVLAVGTGALGTGDTIYAASSYGAAAAAAGTSLYKWVIGTNTQSSGWTPGDAGAGNVTTGFSMAGGVLYDLINSNGTNGNTIKRYLTPGIGISSVFYDTLATGLTGIALNNIASTGTNTIVNNLQSTATATSTTLWSVGLSSSTASTMSLYSWTEYLAVAANAPTPTYPPIGFMVPVNSINGNTSGVVFQWTEPPNLGVIPSTQSYTYSVNIYLDSAAKVGFASATGITSTQGTISASSASAFNVVPVPFNPGTTYYWRVKTTLPVTSPNSAMQSFTVQSLPAAVPSIVSPANGSTITNQTPAFSWSPVSGTTQYDFQLSTTPTFGTTVLTDQPNTAGDLVPVTIPLTQGKQYFWRVRALQPVTGDWSAVANFFVSAPTTTTPQITITSVPAPVITMPAQAAPTTYTIATTPVEKIAPTYIWAIIVIGAILVIAVIVLIVRTRRSV